ncbi:MAG TPA: hypothetical protein VFC23_06040, partial [Thermoanaerobaculia bacterium]|nr:hypothetical protein [Thermoanaerobaculia bacterium]
EELGLDNYALQAFRFGYFSVFRLLRSSQRRKVVEEFHQWYIERCRAFEPDERSRQKRRPSIIAHSFGSYVVGESMLKYKEIRFDKIILCGSILPRDFDWGELVARNQVWCVRNEFGLKDIWVRMVGRFVPRTGDSGYSGFEHDSPCVQQERFDFHEHSDYFKRDHIRDCWKPFLDHDSLSVEIRHGHDIDKQEEFRTILDRTHAIDLLCYGGLPGFDRVDIPRGLGLQWIRIEPDIYTFLVDMNGNRPLGYINAMPVKKGIFEALASGEKDDNQVTADDLVSFQNGGDIYLYLMSIAIEPAARVASEGLFQRSLERLLWAMERKLIDYWRRFGTRIVEVAAVGWTPEGRRLCELLGLREVAKDRHQNPVFRMQVPTGTDSRGRLGHLVERLCQEYEKGEGG